MIKYKGDIFADGLEYGAERKVLEILGDLYFLSDPDDFDVCDGPFTAAEIELMLEDPDDEGILTVTMDEIADHFGVDVDDLRIAKED